MAMKAYFRLMNEKRVSLMNDVGLLAMRVFFAGTMMLAHGWGKLSNFGDMASNFSDPLGVGSTVSLTLATGAEFFCSLLVILGLATRAAVIPLIITMAVAGFIVHSADDFGTKERAFLYLFAFITLFFTGGGRFSLDGVLKKKFQ